MTQHIAVSHVGTDPDTLASAYAYSIYKGIPLFVPDRINGAANMMLEVYITVSSLTPADIEEHSPYTLHLLDFHSYAGLYPHLHGKSIDTIIDHHLEGELQAPHMIIDPIGATSTLVGELVGNLDRDTALALGFGICDDTAGLILHATQRDKRMMDTITDITGRGVKWFMDRLKEAYIEHFRADADTRTYTIGSYTINIGQFRAPGALSYEHIMREISSYVWTLDGDMSLYIVSDPEKNESLIIGKANNSTLTPLLGKLSGSHKLISRKVDVLPFIKQWIKAYT